MSVTQLCICMVVLKNQVTERMVLREKPTIRSGVYVRELEMGVSLDFWGMWTSSSGVAFTEHGVLLLR